MKKILKKQKGISLIEVLVYIGVFSLIAVVIVSFVFWLIRSNLKARAMRETLNSSKRVMELITQEIKEAESIYLPTTSSSQLSLKTEKYLPLGEEISFIDFYLCLTRICLKKESQDPIFLTSESIEITNLVFTQIISGEAPSIRIELSAIYKNPADRPEYRASVDLSSTVSLRSY
jgi:type II secretory pathway pseudopilin PulG